jgi:ABC-type transport system involved in multi-copper enzyme maturation permease subunit
MTFLRSVVVIARLTFAEAVRRKVIVATGLCGLAFLVLFAIGFHFVVRDLGVAVLANRVKRTGILTFFTLAGLYATNFLTLMTAVLLPIDTLSGEIASGVMQTIASKPVRRSAIVLGKWLAFCGVIAGYLALLAGGVLTIVWLRARVALPDLHIGLPLMLLEAIVMLTLSIAGGARFSTVTNGIVAFGFYGVAFLGGWVEQIGTFAGNETARTIGTVASLIMPSESMWQLASHHFQPPFIRGLGAGPFQVGAVPTPAMVWWAVGYVVVVLAIGLRRFATRAL